MTVVFRELENSPRITFDDNGIVNGTREFRLPTYGDWPEFVGDILGTVNQQGGTGFAVKARAHFPGLPWLLASRVNVGPFMPDSPTTTPGTLIDVSTGINTYGGGAKITVDYRTRDVSAAGGGGGGATTEAGTFLTWVEEIGVEVLMTPGRAWRQGESASDPLLPYDVMVPIKIPVATHTLTWSNVARPPRNTIREMRGKLNTIADEAAGFLDGATSHCILFAGAVISRSFQTDGKVRYSLAYTFHERTPTDSNGDVVGWNHEYVAEPKAPATENWIYVTNAVTGEGKYGFADLRNLFRYEN